MVLPDTKVTFITTHIIIISYLWHPLNPIQPDTGSIVGDLNIPDRKQTPVRLIKWQHVGKFTSICPIKLFLAVVECLLHHK